MHLLDTDTISHLHAGHPRVVSHLQAVADSKVGITVVSKIEILRARYDYVMKASEGQQLLNAQHWLDVCERLLAGMLVVPFDIASAYQFDNLRLATRRRQIGRADLLIASIALANSATLVTRNIRHFRRIPNLRIVNSVDS